MKKGYVVQKISSGQLFPEDVNPHCDLDLDLEDTTPRLVMMHHHPKLGWKGFNKFRRLYGTNK